MNGQLVEDEADVPAGENPQCELEVFQVKEERGFKESALQCLIDHLPLLLQLEPDAKLSVEFNPQILERMAIFRAVYFKLADKFPDLMVRVRYVTKSADPANDKVLAKAGRLKAKVRESFPHAEVAVEMIGAQLLNDMARRRKIAALTLKLSEVPLYPDRGGLACLVNLVDYLNFISNDEGRLREEVFEQNVRDYEGDTVINKGISESLRQGDQVAADFWWLNNGITVLGKKVLPSGKRILIEDPQIVNGLQTSRSIYHHFRASRTKKGDQIDLADPTDSRQVLVRVLEADDEALAAQIIKATNSQNRVSAASLRAAEPFQRSIEEYFYSRGLFYERKKNYYKNLGKPRFDIVDVLELAQAVASVLLYKPDTARARPSTLVGGRLYGKVFSESTPLSAYWNCLQVLRRVDKFLADHTDTGGRHDRLNVRFHLARAASAFALPSSKPRPIAVSRVELGLFDDDFLAKSLKWVTEVRESVEEKIEIVDPNVIAKGPEWVAEIDRRLSRYTAKSTWPKALVPRRS